MESVEMMARRPSRQVNCSPEAEVSGGDGTIREGTQVSLTVGTQVILVVTIVTLTFGAAAAWFTTKSDIQESKAQTAALRDLVTSYISDSNKKWEQNAIDRANDQKDREADRAEARKWREELKDAIRSIK